MKKSLKRGIFIAKPVHRFMSQRRVKLLVTNNRASTITRRMVGRTFSVYNGKFHRRTLINRLMVGHHLGEFVVTKKLGSLIHHQKKHEKKKKIQIETWARYVIQLPFA